MVFLRQKLDWTVHFVLLLEIIGGVSLFREVVDVVEVKFDVGVIGIVARHGVH